MNLIIEGIRKRDKDVFKTFFTKHYPEYVVYANGYLFDKAASEDIVQDVFIYLWENADKINIKSSLKGYLYAAIRNRCLNYLKSIKVIDKSHILEFNISLITEQIFDTITEENKEVVYNSLMTILETLPEKMQQIVKLKYLHNYKYKEIANELNISINTVKTQLKRAKSKIRNLISLLLYFGWTLF